MAYMSHFRPIDSRIPLRIPYNELVAERPLVGVITDVSEAGVRVERVLRNTAAGSRIVQLEFELPGTSEVIWAKGELAFDHLRRNWVGLPPVRTSGVRLVAAAGRHLRLLRDYVIELRRAMLDPSTAEAAPAPIAEPVDTDAGDWFQRAYAYR
jgi:hypothetical protein